MVGCDIKRQKPDWEFMMYLYVESRTVVACWLWLFLKKGWLNLKADEMVWAMTKGKVTRQKFSSDKCQVPVNATCTTYVTCAYVN